MRRAVELPDPVEPYGDGRGNPIGNLLTSFGRGDWFQRPRSLETSVIRILTMMNDGNIVQRTFGSQRGLASSRVAQLAASGRPERELVDELFLATLGRFPTSGEVDIVTKRRSGHALEDWLADIQWALVNKAEFIFNE